MILGFTLFLSLSLSWKSWTNFVLKSTLIYKVILTFRTLNPVEVHDEKENT